MERFPEALDGVPDAVLIVDAEGVVRAANERVRSVLGYAPDDLEGRAFETLVFDPDGGAAGRELHRYVVDPEPRSMSASLDMCARRADGTDVPVTLSLGPFDRDGETYLVVTLVDVREERAEQAELHRRTQTLEALHEATQDLLKTTEREVAAEAAVEYVEEVLGHPITGIWLYDEGRDALDPHVWTDAADAIVGEHPVFSAEGRSISWQVFESGKPEYVADIGTDPDRYNPDSPIRSELVLPLGRYGIINVGATEPDAFDDSDLAVARIWAATVTMVFVRIERERQLRAREDEVARERDRLEALRAVAEESWDSVDTAAAELTIADDLALRGDRSRLRQALENLFVNAVTHAGADVRVEVGALNDSAGDVGFYVADDGPGIPDDVRDRAFDAGVSTDEDGTGFGLKIVAEVADAHGWSLALGDAEAGGARFEFRGVERADAADVDVDVAAD